MQEITLGLLDLPSEVLLAAGFDRCTMLKICRGLRDLILGDVDSITMKNAAASASAVRLLSRHSGASGQGQASKGKRLSCGWAKAVDRARTCQRALQNHTSLQRLWLLRTTRPGWACTTSTYSR